MHFSMFGEKAFASCLIVITNFLFVFLLIGDWLTTVLSCEAYDVQLLTMIIKLVSSSICLRGNASHCTTRKITDEGWIINYIFTGLQFLFELIFTEDLKLILPLLMHSHLLLHSN